MNLWNVQFGVQDPGVSLPAGVERGAAPQRLELSAEQVSRFQEDGFILIPGAMRHWVEYLREVADYQVENPHSLAINASRSGSYEYIHINCWMTNDGIRDFFYFSPLGHVLAQLGQTEEVRISTDNLLVNPKKCFGWHQDNQTGPIDSDIALRFWASMDPCSPGAGAPEYVLGSHRGSTTARDVCYVEGVENGGATIERPEVQPGDLLVWHARTVHRLVVPPGIPFARGATQRRVISGTAVKEGGTYWRRTTSGVMGDAAGHDLRDGEPLGGPYFPRIYPEPLEAEVRARASGELVARSPFKVFERKFQAQLEAWAAQLPWAAAPQR
mmetsp:Transcript_5615/g.21235  ORF Transcript_5615/g.21235 Transcript_5615/m.21235 type:complete len:327 (-) Transcript_5615:31-1011(-)